MNIFFLDYNPLKAAQFLHDNHVNKMLLESAQMLSTAMAESEEYRDSWHKFSGFLPEDVKLYKPTHANHPCSVWLRKSWHNMAWLSHHAMALADEFQFRRHKAHACQPLVFIINQLIQKQSTNILLLTPPAQAMPEEYKHDDPVIAYREYYAHEKIDHALVSWTRRPVPDFLINHVDDYVRKIAGNLEGNRIMRLSNPDHVPYNKTPQYREQLQRRRFKNISNPDAVKAPKKFGVKS